MDAGKLRERKIVRWGGAIVLALLFLNCLGLTDLLDLVVNLLFGWAPFLMHAGLEAPGLAWALVAASLVSLLIAAILVSGPSTRPISRGVLLVGALLLGLTAGFAALGVTRQVVALAHSPDPLFGLKNLHRRVKSVQNLREITVGALKSDRVQNRPSQESMFDDQGRGQHSWLTYLLPYVGQQDLFDHMRFDRPWSDPTNARAIRTFVPPYRLYYEPEHTADGLGIGHYSLNARLIEPEKTPPQADLPDGAANTIFAGEVIQNVPAWAQPANWRDPALGLNKSSQGFGSPHPNGLNVSLADGSVRFLTNEIDPAVLRALATPDGGEQIDLEKLRP